MEHVSLFGSTQGFEEYNFCPFCHFAMKPARQAAVGGDLKLSVPGIITIIWTCPVDSCKKEVVTIYRFKETKGGVNHYEFKEFLNGEPQMPAWPQFVHELENGNPDDPVTKEPSKFVEIYRQALTAEFKGLNEIAGIGFRRAFEFLIKDFAIMEHPNEKAEIMTLLLVPVIKKFYPPDYLPIMERAAWLGNDETHYERKHPSYNLSDLKRVITYVITDLDGKKQREALINGMPKK